MLIVTFHDGGDGSSAIAAYTDSGQAIPGEVLAKPKSPASTGAAELRGLAFAPNGDLLVLNGAKSASEILAYRPTKLPYPYFDRLAWYPNVESLWHPFDLTFSYEAGKLFWYVSNQDTNVVARLEVGADGKLKPAPIAPALPPGSFLEGTFVASSNGDLPHVKQTTAVKTKLGGLEVEIEDGKIAHSVRGTLWTNGALYVADEPAEAVKVYGARGEYLGHATLPAAPTHLLAGKGVLLVSAADGIYWANLDPNEPGRLAFQSKPGLPVSNASGLAFGAGGSGLYVGERKAKKIRRYGGFFPDSLDSSTTFPVAGQPEFILYVPD